MSIAYWCVLVAALLPYFTVGIAKSRTRDAYDNADPRKPGLYSGLAHRAHGAHQNGFEAFPFFASAVFVASAGSPQAHSSVLNALAVAWIVARLGYTFAYIGNRPNARSLVWAVGLLLAIAIFTMPAWCR